jgi:hypothetical protein
MAEDIEITYGDNWPGEEAGSTRTYERNPDGSQGEVKTITTTAKKKKTTPVVDPDTQALLDEQAKQLAALQAKLDAAKKAALLAGTETTTTTPDPAASLAGDQSAVPWQEELPVAAWAKAFGIPAMGGTPVQDWLSRQAAPSYASYMAGSYLNPQENPTDWANYMANSGWKGAQQSAKGLFSQALSDPNGQNSFVDVMGDYLDSFMKNVLGNYYAAPIANKLAGKVGALQTEYQGNTSGTGTSFLDYLKNKYNLGGVLGGNTGGSDLVMTNSNDGAPAGATNLI